MTSPDIDSSRQLDNIPIFGDIGRPLYDLSILDNFRQQLDSGAGVRQFSVEHVEIPAVVYAFKQEVRIAYDENLNLQEVVDTQSLIDRLVETKVIDGYLAVNGLSIAVHKVVAPLLTSRYKGIPKFDVRVNLGGLMYDPYSGLPIFEEKRAIRAGIGLNVAKKPNLEKLNLNLLVATVSCDDVRFFDNYDLERLKRTLDKKIVLGPVGEV